MRKRQRCNQQQFLTVYRLDSSVSRSLLGCTLLPGPSGCTLPDSITDSPSDENIGNRTGIHNEDSVGVVVGVGTGEPESNPESVAVRAGNRMRK